MVCRVPHNEVVQVVNDALSKRIQDLDQIKTDMDADLLEVQQIESEMNAKLELLPKSSDLAEDTGATLIGTSSGITLQAKLNKLDTTIEGLAPSSGVNQLANTVAGHTNSISNLNSEVSNLNSEISGLDTTLSGLATEVDTKAPLASPALTGTPTVPTAAVGNNSTLIASTAFVAAAIAALVDSSPEALNTLNELAAALGDDPNFATTVTNQLSLKAPLASPSLTGIPLAPTADAGTNSTQIATTEFVATAIENSSVGETLGVSNYYYTVVGGESTITVPSSYAALNVQAIYIDGLRQDPGYGFTFNSSTQVITLAETLNTNMAGTVITIQLSASNAENPDTVLSSLATNSGAGLVKTSSGNTVQVALDSKLNKTGVTDGSEATAGQIGEYKAVDMTTALSLTNGIAANITSISLTAGDWDLEGIATFVNAANANGTNWAIGLSTTSATMATDQKYLANLQPGTAQTVANTVRLHTATCRFNLSATTTIYLVGVSAFTANTSTVIGSIRARRVR